MKKCVILLILFSLAIVGKGDIINPDKSRSAEIKEIMWGEASEAFQATEVPQKWKDEQAVYIARDFRFSYYKAPLMGSLKYDRYIHLRVKVLSKPALEQYSEFDLDGSNYTITNYAGFKIIKPSGEEIEISLEDLPKETINYNRYNWEIYKLAIPNLEIGDILDYYQVEERKIPIYNTKFYAFDPVIFELNGPHPVMKQRFRFDVLRRCYINLKSLNGVPEFRKSWDEGEDINSYVLDDENREKLENVRWLHNFREVPTVKFKVTYASAGMAYSTPIFLGNSGELKSSVTRPELWSFISLVQKAGLPAGYKSAMKKNFGDIQDKRELAETAYYLMRYFKYTKNGEQLLLVGNYDHSRYRFFDELSKFYRSKDIAHDVIIGIPRSISKIDDLILENELRIGLRFTEGGDTTYITDFQANTPFGFLEPELQGTEVYFYDGLHAQEYSALKRDELPIVPHGRNNDHTSYKYEITDLQSGEMNVLINKKIYGAFQVPYHHVFTDVYLIKEEDVKKYPFHEEMTFASRKNMENYRKQSSEIKKNLSEDKRELLEGYLRDHMRLDIMEASPYRIPETGRYDPEKPLQLEYDLQVTGPIKKVGPNYILEVGNMIEQNELLEEDELERKYNIYMPFARKLSHKVEIDIPEGFQVEGLGNIETLIENQVGVFESRGVVSDGKLTVDMMYLYYSNYEDVENWDQLVSILEAQKEFYKAKLLLKLVN